MYYLLNQLSTLNLELSNIQSYLLSNIQNNCICFFWHIDSNSQSTTAATHVAASCWSDIVLHQDLLVLPAWTNRLPKPHQTSKLWRMVYCTGQAQAKLFRNQPELGTVGNVCICCLCMYTSTQYRCPMELLQQINPAKRDKWILSVHVRIIQDLPFLP